jgi:hypothetical protein
MKIAVYENTEGNLSLLRPAYDSPQRPENLTDDEYLDLVILKDIPSDRNVFIIDNDDLPEDRSNRDNWILQDGQVIDPG